MGGGAPQGKWDTGARGGRFLGLREMGAGHVQVQQVPSHLDVHGNEEADALVSRGSGLHPKNRIPLSKRQHVTEWDALGVEPVEDPAL